MECRLKRDVQVSDIVAKTWVWILDCAGNAVARVTKGRKW